MRDVELTNRELYVLEVNAEGRVPTRIAQKLPSKDVAGTYVQMHVAKLGTQGATKRVLAEREAKLAGVSVRQAR